MFYNKKRKYCNSFFLVKEYCNSYARFSLFMIQHGANRDGFEQLLIWPIMSNAGHAGSCSKIIIKLLPHFVNLIAFFRIYKNLI